jgi:hypothetical protein
MSPSARGGFGEDAREGRIVDRLHQVGIEARFA